MKTFPPRPGDLPRKELVALADKTIAQFGGPTQASIRFKFTCSHCGTRCTLVEDNTLYAEGECCECGQSTLITHGGLSLRFKVGSEDPNRMEEQRRKKEDRAYIESPESRHSWE